MMGKWSDDSVCSVVYDVRLCCVGHRSDDVCVMCSELLMTSSISCPLRSSVYKCQKGELTSPVKTECGMFVMYYIMQCCISVSAVL